MVEDNEVIEKEELPFDYSSDYWEKRYVIRREKIPVFLERVADVILLTGKYLNVIRQCGKLTCQTDILIIICLLSHIIGKDCGPQVDFSPLIIDSIW